MDQTVFSYVGYEVLAVMTTKSATFREVTTCSSVENRQRFAGTYFLHPQGRKVSQARNQRQAGYLLSQ
jgi:hypothetical protein